MKKAPSNWGFCNRRPALQEGRGLGVVAYRSLVRDLSIKIVLLEILAFFDRYNL